MSKRGEKHEEPTVEAEKTLSATAAPAVIADPTAIAFADPRASEIAALRAELQKRPNIPPHILKICGEAEMHELVDILCSSDITDVDSLFLTANISEEELFQYIRCLPEYHRLRCRILELAEKIAKNIATPTRIRFALMKSFKQITEKSPMGPVKRNILRQDAGIVEPFRLLDDLVMHFRPKQSGGTYRIGLLVGFRYLASSILLFAALDDLHKWGIHLPATIKGFVDLLTGPACQKNRYFSTAGGDTTGDTTQNALSYEAATSFREVITHFEKSFNKLLDALPTEESETAKAENDGKQAEIFDLAMEYDLEQINFDINGVLVDLRRIGNPNFDCHNICAIQIILNPQKPDASRLFFRLDSSNGKIYLGETFLDLADYLPAEKFEKIRKLIYDRVLDGLMNSAAKPDDWLIGFVTPPTAITAEVAAESAAAAEVTAATAETVTATSESTTAGDLTDTLDEAELEALTRPETSPDEKVSPGTLSIYSDAPSSYQPEPTTTTPEPPPTEQPPETTDQDKKLRLHRQITGSLSGREVLRILRRLLGDEIRVSGSHFFFTAPNGLTLPIPINLDRSVSRHLLRRNLEKWDIAREFIEELTS